MHRRLFASLLAATAPQLEQFDARPEILVANWVGPDGELVLLARDAKYRLVGDPLVVPHGADRLTAIEALWDRLVETERPIKLLP